VTQLVEHLSQSWKIEPRLQEDAEVHGGVLAKLARAVRRWYSGDMRTMSIVLGFVLAASAVGCADNKPTSAKPKLPLTSAFKSSWDTKATDDGAVGKGGEGAGGSGAGIDTPSLHVSDAIARLCNLPRTSINAMFDFDSTSIGPDDKAVLAALAQCLSDGALKGRAIALTGRADARGEMEYNMSLGGARADSVKRYLHDLGVQPNRVSASSRGELDATGVDETTWALDRRVDVDLQ